MVFPDPAYPDTQWFSSFNSTILSMTSVCNFVNLFKGTNHFTFGLRSGLAVKVLDLVSPVLNNLIAGVVHIRIFGTAACASHPVIIKELNRHAAEFTGFVFFHIVKRHKRMMRQGCSMVCSTKTVGKCLLFETYQCGGTGCCLPHILRYSMI